MTAESKSSVSRRAFIAGAAVVAVGAAIGARSQFHNRDSAPSAAAAAGAPRNGGRLRVGLSAGSAKDSLDAKAALTDADIARQNQLYDTLLHFDPAFKIQPALAESVEASERASVWTIRLRKGVTFHNGKPLTAQDIAYTLAYALDPARPGASAARLRALDMKSTQVLDDLTLRVRFQSPFSMFREVLADAGTAALRVVPQGYDPAQPVGTGPFVFERFEPGVRSVFKRNPHYWRPDEPHVDALELLNFTDDAARVNALLSNQIDALANLPANQMAIVKANPQLRLIVSETGAWNPFTMRVDVAPFDDVRVRKALRLLVDREQLVQQVLAGQGYVANDIFARYDHGYATDLAQREVDIDQAKSLLRQAGREHLSAEIVTSPVSIGLVPAAEALVQQASRADVQLSLRQIEPSTFFSRFFMKAPLSQSYWGTRNYLLQAADSMMPTSPYNETHWHDDAWLKLVQAGFAEQDEAKRAELIRAAQHIEYDEGGYINWGWYNKIDVVRSNIEGFVPDRSGFSLTSFAFRRAWFSA
ncbi:ABC transporter substrate-binding protein [Paraburkholderia sp.]|uniref:ABC transporter substrate-binding protein n=1 Tax=Paraburkholderia sp. TaxID=1926495 RepID=UPI00238A3B8D|nr:ABC transporter substrate-binding protein [Paraburkholderia sp.]MDE1180831.1 ABC transporter substrate-binding protein [Paraburkholderia sp.]